MPSKNAYTYRVEIVLTIQAYKPVPDARVASQVCERIDRKADSTTRVLSIARVNHLPSVEMDYKKVERDVLDQLAKPKAQTDPKTTRLVNSIGTGKVYVARVKTSDDKRRWAIFNNQHILYGKPHYGQVAMRSLWVSKYGDPLEWVIYGDVFEQSELAATIATIQEQYGTKGE